MPMTPEEIVHFNAALRVDSEIDTYARDSARDVLERCFKFKHHPRHTPDQVYLNQAAALIEADLKWSEQLGPPLTTEEQAHYRERFTAAYMSMFRDNKVYMAEWKSYKEKHPGESFIIVCFR